MKSKSVLKVVVFVLNTVTNNVILKVINAIKKLSENKNEIKEEKAGVPYITYNNNTFIAQENLGPKELEEQQKIKEGENDI